LLCQLIYRIPIWGKNLNHFFAFFLERCYHLTSQNKANLAINILILIKRRGLFLRHVFYIIGMDSIIAFQNMELESKRGGKNAATT
jgi:hypothetical protein